MEANNTTVEMLVAKLAQNARKVQDQARKASDVLTGPLDTAIAKTPYEIVFQDDRVKLKHYSPETRNRLKTPLLIVYALINRETMLDLQPGRSVVQSFLDQGVDVYMIDWGYPTRKDRYLTIKVWQPARGFA